MADTELSSSLLNIPCSKTGTVSPSPEIIESCLFAQGTPSGDPSVHPPRWGRFFDALSLEGGGMMFPVRCGLAMTRYALIFEG